MLFKKNIPICYHLLDILIRGEKGRVICIISVWPLYLCVVRGCGVPPKSPWSTKVLLPAARRRLAVAGLRPFENFPWSKRATPPKVTCPPWGSLQPKTD